MEAIYYLWHWFKLQAIDACLGIHRLTGRVFLPEELLLLLLVATVTLAVFAAVALSLVGYLRGERTDWK